MLSELSAEVLHTPSRVTTTARQKIYSVLQDIQNLNEHYSIPELSQAFELLSKACNNLNKFEEELDDLINDGNKKESE